MTYEERKVKEDELGSARNILDSVTEEVQYWEWTIKSLEKELRMVSPKIEAKIHWKVIPGAGGVE